MNAGPTMNFHPIDLTIIALYLIANAFPGITIRKEATKHTQAYFLGDRKEDAREGLVFRGENGGIYRVHIR
jgi:hypothetical protein